MITVRIVIGVKVPNKALSDNSLDKVSVYLI